MSAVVQPLDGFQNAVGELSRIGSDPFDRLGCLNIRQLGRSLECVRNRVRQACRPILQTRVGSIEQRLGAIRLTLQTRCENVDPLFRRRRRYGQGGFSFDGDRPRASIENVDCSRDAIGELRGIALDAPDQIGNDGIGTFAGPIDGRLDGTGEPFETRACDVTRCDQRSLSALGLLAKLADQTIRLRFKRGKRRGRRELRFLRSRLDATIQGVAERSDRGRSLLELTLHVVRSRSECRSRAFAFFTQSYGKCAKPFGLALKVGGNGRAGLRDRGPQVLDLRTRSVLNGRQRELGRGDIVADLVGEALLRPVQRFRCALDRFGHATRPFVHGETSGNESILDKRHRIRRFLADRGDPFGHRRIERVATLVEHRGKGNLGRRELSGHARGHRLGLLTERFHAPPSRTVEAFDVLLEGRLERPTVLCKPTFGLVGSGNHVGRTGLHNGFEALYRASDLNDAGVECANCFTATLAHDACDPRTSFVQFAPQRFGGRFGHGDEFDQTLGQRPIDTRCRVFQRCVDAITRTLNSATKHFGTLFDSPHGVVGRR